VVPAGNGGRILLGWFQLKAPDAKRRSQWENLIHEGDFVTLIEQAAELGVEPTMFDPIKELIAGSLEPTVSLWMYFDEKAARFPVGRRDLGRMEPLTLT
jgi:hypothetical protein